MSFLKTKQDIEVHPVSGLAQFSHFPNKSQHTQNGCHI